MSSVTSFYPIVLLTAVGALFVLSRLVVTAGYRAGDDAVRVAWIIVTGLWAWFIFAVGYALTVGLTFESLAPMLAVPWSLGLWAMFSRQGSRILSALPVHLLVALSVYRVVGAVFLYAYYCCDLLSRGFALNAGWGDVLTGVLALPVAWAALKQVPHTGLLIVLWSVIGIGDLILAPASAAMYGAGRLDEFPLSLIPLFLGPPFGILLHGITLRAAWLQRARPTGAV